jgi:hypothetical protein
MTDSGARRQFAPSPTEHIRRQAANQNASGGAEGATRDGRLRRRFPPTSQLRCLPEQIAAADHLGDVAAAPTPRRGSRKP